MKRTLITYAMFSIILSVCVPIPDTERTPLPTATIFITPTSHPTRTSLPTPSVIPTLGVGSVSISPIDGMVQVFVPTGEFSMGGSDDHEDTLPEHIVYLDAFWIDQTEVTNSMFEFFVSETGHQTEAEITGESWLVDKQINTTADFRHPQGLDSDIEGLDNHPVVHVSWNDAVAYCIWADRRLPSEAEWEKAALGTEGNKYPWGVGYTELGNYLNYNFERAVEIWGSGNDITDDGFQYTSPVGSFPDGASPFGALGLSGNVDEWIADWYDQNYYANSPRENPQGPSNGQYKSTRGSSWYDAGVVAAIIRRFIPPEITSNSLGFRCARSP